MFCAYDQKDRGGISRIPPRGVHYLRLYFYMSADSLSSVTATRSARGLGKIRNGDPFGRRT